jgi:hypothetical protein
MADRRSAQDTVCLAVGLGWLLAELYDSRRLPGPPPDDDERPLPPHLPGIGAMTPYEKAYALAAHVGADLARLEALGLGMPTAKSIQAVLDTPGHARDDVRRVVHDLYLDIRNRLAGTDPAAALAFGLGRMLAAAAAVGSTVWAALTFTPSGTDRVVAVLVSAAGFLGLSWAGVRAALGRAVRQAEHAMWDAEVVAAIGKAATIIPDHDESGPAAAELADAGMASRP